MDTSVARKVYLWSVPRSLSTAFLRSMSTIPKSKVSLSVILTFCLSGDLCVHDRLMLDMVIFGFICFLNIINLVSTSVGTRCLSVCLSVCLYRLYLILYVLKNHQEAKGLDANVCL